MIESKLISANFEFSQEGNYEDTDDIEMLTIECKSSLGIDNDEGCYYVLRTKQWSFDSLNELQKLIDRINKIIKK